MTPAVVIPATVAEPTARRSRAATPKPSSSGSARSPDARSATYCATPPSRSTCEKAPPAAITSTIMPMLPTERPRLVIRSSIVRPRRTPSV